MIYYVLQLNFINVVFFDFIWYRLGEIKKYIKGIDN